MNGKVIVFTKMKTKKKGIIIMMITIKNNRKSHSCSKTSTEELKEIGRNKIKRIKKRK